MNLILLIKTLREVIKKLVYLWKKENEAEKDSIEKKYLEGEVHVNQKEKSKKKILKPKNETKQKSSTKVSFQKEEVQPSEELLPSITGTKTKKINNNET